MLHFMNISDYSAGFGGKYGVQKDRKDKSAVGWEYQEKVEKHESQKGVYDLFIIQLNGHTTFSYFIF